MTLDEIKNQIDLIKAVGHPKYRKAILGCADKKLIKALCEIIFNVLQNNINISAKLKARLIRQRGCIRNLCNKSSFAVKKKTLIQKGGFLQFLIPAVIGGIAEIISSYITKPSAPTPPAPPSTPSTPDNE
jgi:hypothetical protein